MSQFARRLQTVKKTTSTPPGPSSWPDATNTGYRGSLTSYTGASTINVNTTITNKIINDDLQILAGATLTISNCLINAHIDADYATQLVTISDSEINASSWQGAGIAGAHLRIYRCNMTGGQRNILSSGDTIVEDCWLHSQYGGPVGSSYHNNAFISNGGSNITIRHNRLDCSLPENGTGGGPTADASIFGDFATMTDVTFDNNLFMPTTGGYGGTFGYNSGKPFGSNPVNIVVTNNVFQRGTSGQCGVFGPVTSFKIGGPGHVWSNNTYEDDGEIIPPST